MQNISFLAILAVLLGCAFFFSQQTNLSSDTPDETEPTDEKDETLADIPTCNDSLTGEEMLSCLNDAVEISGRLVDNTVDEILSLEPAADQRMDFMDTQLAWEDSRDMDCDYAFNKNDQTGDAAIQRAQCLLDHNLERLARLESYLCDWFTESGCEPSALSFP